MTGSKTTLPKFASLVVAGLLTMYAHPATAQSGSNREQQSTLDGVYTVEQARRGEKVTKDVCSACHFQDWFTEILIQSWAGAPLSMLYELMVATMPQDSPGGLTPQQYADVLAYIFELNEFPAGQEELSANKEALRGILIEQKRQSER